MWPISISISSLVQIDQELAEICLLCIFQDGGRRRFGSPTMSQLLGSTPYPGKKEASSFSTISLAFLDRFLYFLHQWKQE